MKRRSLWSVNKKIWTVLAVSALLCVLLAGCGGKKGVYEKSRRGYEMVTAVPGICFEIPEGLSEFATAVSKISDDMGFEPSITYEYKDLNGNYFLFCMEDVVIAAQKGTSYLSVAQEAGVEQAVTGKDLFGIWFGKTGKTLSYETDEQKGVVKLIADVNASVALTKELYNDFTGELAVVGSGEEEWSVFVGIPSTQYEKATEKSQDGIAHVARSMRLYDGNTAARPEEDLVEEETETLQDGLQDTGDGFLVVQEKETETAETSETAAEEETAEETGEETSGAAGEGTDVKTIQLNNQRKGKTTSRASYSTVYSTLEAGDSGYAEVMDKQASLQSMVVTLDQVLQGGDAAKLMMAAMGDGFIPASAGMTWHAAEYHIDYSGEEKLYLNILFTGMDGENLRYRGIRYSHKTYGIEYEGKRYACYMVPNGCTEYLVRFGDSPVEGAACAFYHVEVEE